MVTVGFPKGHYAFNFKDQNGNPFINDGKEDDREYDCSVEFDFNNLLDNAREKAANRFNHFN